MPSRCSIGLDFGTNSTRALIVDISDGREVASHVWNYVHGDAGVILSDQNPDLARQHPLDYLHGLEKAITGALKTASLDKAFSKNDIVGIGVDTTGSTPMPIDAKGASLALDPRFANEPAALAWLWKDHTGYAEAEELTAAAAKDRPAYLAKCGGRYSSEWFWAKILRCARTAPAVFEAANTWVEIADWIPAVLCGTTRPERLRRGICAAGHKAFFNSQWGGYPDEAFLSSLHPGLARVRRSLPEKLGTIAEPAGTLSGEWAEKLGLAAGIPVAIGAFDAHLGAVGAGICDGTLVKIMGTSTCDIMITPLSRALADVPGLCGIVPESVLPGYFGLEAGQSGVGDIFNWFVRSIQPGGEKVASHDALTASAETLKPGESGLLGLDWHNGNRTVLVDQRLTGLIVGLTLHTKPAEIYRALIESTAYGARTVIARLEEYGVPVRRVVNCGGIAARSPLTMQIYADVFNRPIAISRSTQTSALGSAIAGAVVAGPDKGHLSFQKAVAAMTGLLEKVYTPIPANVRIYERLFQLYHQMHDAFGIRGTHVDLSNVMKELLDIRDLAKAV